MRRMVIAIGMVLTMIAPASADIITQWNFNGESTTTVPGGTSSPTTSLGTGTASLFNGTTATFASGTANGGSSDPTNTTPSNYGWNVSTFAAQDGAARGVQFNVSTVGFQAITINWDQRHSNAASRGVEFFYSTDGSTFTSFGSIADATGGDTWFNGRSIDLSSNSAVVNNPNFAFRILQRATNGTSYGASNSTSTYASTGTWRFDMVTINGISTVPEPTSLALLGSVIAGVAGFRFRRSLA